MMRQVHAATRVAALVAAMAILGPAALGADRVDGIDLTEYAGDVAEISSTAVVVVAGTSRQALPLADVSEVTLGAAADPMAAAGAVVVVTSGGDVLTAATVSAGEGKVKLGGTILGDVTLELASVRMIYMPPKPLAARDCDRILRDVSAGGEAARDVLLVRRKGADPMAVEGVLKAMDADNITFAWKEQDRQVARQTVLAVQLATAAAAPQRSAVLLGADGSSISLKSLTMTGSAASVQTAWGADATVERKLIASVRMESQRVAALADIKPAAVKEQGFFDRTFTYRLNKSCAGGPLKLGGRVYSGGLGVHSACELTYKLDGAYTRLVAMVGIDDSVRPAGDATLVVLVDGKAVGEPLRLTGKTDPVPLRVDVAKAREVTIRVEYGNDKLDVADRVDLAAARLIR
jgi:hypothetical protein